MPRGIRFSPPQVRLTPELSWVLRRALGPTEAGATGSKAVEGEPAVALATRLDLAARIGGRVPFEVLEEEVGEPGAEELRRRHRVAAGAWLEMESCCRDIAKIAHELDVPITFLKGAALNLSRTVPLGQRLLADVDVLAPRSAAARLRAALLGEGFTGVATSGTETELEPVRHPSGVWIEIQFAVRGLRCSGPGFADLEALDAAGMLETLPGWPGRVTVMRRPALLAHLVVHALVQHGFMPGSYPPLRILADVHDLGLAEDGLGEGWRLVEQDLSVDEVRALGLLSERLAAGEPPEDVLLVPGSEGVLFQHLVGAAIDERYRRVLRWRHLAQPLTGGARWRGIARKLWANATIPSAQLERLYGRPASPLLRLRRFIDLARDGLTSLAEDLSSRGGRD